MYTPRNFAQDCAHSQANGPLRLGVVSYLNSRPLVEFLPEVLPEAVLRFDTPARLSDQLAAGEIDVGLVPVVEWFRHPEWCPLSDACIACRGPVRSVVLLGRKDLSEIRTLAADISSRTSIALTRLLLQERFGISPVVIPLPLETPPQRVETDAVLLIGDRAIGYACDGWPFVWDLGQLWTNWTGLPFVFALWLGRPEVKCEKLNRLLALARDIGLERIDEICQRHAGQVGWSISECKHYLRDNLWFYLDDDTVRGLELFRTLVTSRRILEYSSS